jgi:hypothetical protein
VLHYKIFFHIFDTSKSHGDKEYYYAAPSKAQPSVCHRWTRNLYGGAHFQQPRFFGSHGLCLCIRQPGNEESVSFWKGNLPPLFDGTGIE